MRSIDLGDKKWAQLPGESDVQYRMFLRYLEAPNRAKVKRLIAREFGVSPATVYKISAVNKWAQRAHAYDKAMAEQAAVMIPGAASSAQIREILMQAFERAILRLVALVDEMDALRLLEFCKFARSLINELSSDREVETAHKKLLEMLKELNLIEVLRTHAAGGNSG